MNLSKATPIGGFFELEEIGDILNSEYYSNLYAFNSARNTLEILLKNRKIQKIYLPSFFCNVILEPILKTKCTYSFYDLNENLEISEYIELKKNESLLYINYFGIKQDYVKKLTSQYEKLIIDNSQAFFDEPLSEIDTFYSPRKFFGIPDGGYLSTNLEIDLESFEKANSENRISHLIKRKLLGPELAYQNFIENEKKLNDLPIQRMSNYTKNVLSSINYSEACNKRRGNFEKLQDTLSKLNKLHFNYSEKTVPLCYPLYVDNGNEIRNNLIKHKIYIPKYWPNLERLYKDFEITEQLVDNIVALPIDQRYNLEDMNYILKILKLNLN